MASLRISALLAAARALQIPSFEQEVRLVWPRSQVNTSAVVVQGLSNDSFPPVALPALQPWLPLVAQQEALDLLDESLRGAAAFPPLGRATAVLGDLTDIVNSTVEAVRNALRGNAEAESALQDNSTASVTASVTAPQDKHGNIYWDMKAAAEAANEAVELAARAEKAAMKYQVTESKAEEATKRWLAASQVVQAKAREAGHASRATVTAVAGSLEGALSQEDIVGHSDAAEAAATAAAAAARVAAEAQLAQAAAEAANERAKRRFLRIVQAMAGRVNATIALSTEVAGELTDLPEALGEISTVTSSPTALAPAEVLGNASANISGNVNISGSANISGNTTTSSPAPPSLSSSPAPSSSGASRGAWKRPLFAVLAGVTLAALIAVVFVTLPA
mmetsp:Transcript_92448/g.280950  ORF Transcript_92448/g.280950 Transcript_92448/m.280950 type:complete len:392 (+) Transcript_92448:80-1255(+)